MIRSGQVTVTTAGTAVQASTNDTKRKYTLRAHSANTGAIFIGNDGADDVTSANGFVMLAADPAIIFEGKLSELWVDAAVNGEKLTWLQVIEGV